MAPEAQNNQAHGREHAESVHQSRPATQERPQKQQAPADTAMVVEAAPAVVSNDLVLPLNVVSRADISRSLRELDTLIDYFHQASLRGAKPETMPVLGKVLDSIASANSMNILHPEDRDKLKDFLTHIKAKAPVVHMSFPSEPGAPFLAKIIEWFRREAHPYTVLHVGLQPELAAGCLVRTSNKHFDFSFRRRFEQSKQKLISALEEANKKIETEMQAQSTSSTQPEVAVTETVETAEPAAPAAQVVKSPTSEPESDKAAEAASKPPEGAGL